MIEHVAEIGLAIDMQCRRCAERHLVPQVVQLGRQEDTALGHPAAIFVPTGALTVEVSDVESLVRVLSERP